MDQSGTGCSSSGSGSGSSNGSGSSHGGKDAQPPYLLAFFVQFALLSTAVHALHGSISTALQEASVGRQQQQQQPRRQGMPCADSSSSSSSSMHDAAVAFQQGVMQALVEQVRLVPE
jgi:hypothetical protein